MTSPPLDGGCFCGAIRYRLTETPQGSMICHCRTCRKLFGAPVVGWLSVHAGAFSFTRGTPATFSTSAPITRWFCGTCGTHLAYVDEKEPDDVEVSTCSLDDPARTPPTHHSWLSHDLPWTTFGDGLPAFARSRYEAVDK